MPLRGELSSVDLAHIFQMLILNQKAGTLEIEWDGVKRSLVFTPDGVHVPFEPEALARRALRRAVRDGRLDEKHIERARNNMGVLKKDVLATLVEMKVLSPEDRFRALKGELEEEVYELFFLKDATFEFRDGDLPGEDCQLQLEPALSPNGLIMEAARRIDEWEYIKTLVASGGDIVEAIDEIGRLDDEEVDVDARTIYDALDGVRTVDDVIEATQIPRFVVFRKIALMVDGGVAVSVPVERLLERAHECLAEERMEAATHLFERSIELGANDVSVYAGAGQAYETLGESRRAADLYLTAGRRAESEGDLGAALRLYQRIREVLPTQVEARLRLFALRNVASSSRRRGAYDPNDEGFALACILRDLERHDELLLVLSGLLDLAEHRPDQIERVSDHAAKLGQVAFAIDALLRSAAERENARDFEGAVRTLKRAQTIDPSRGELEARIRRLNASMQNRRRRHRSVVRGVAMMIAFALMFVGYGRYSKAAMEAYALYSVEDFVVARRFDQGRSHYDTIVRRYPLTIPFLLSFEKLRELDVAERHSVDVERYRAEVDGDRRKSNLNQAKMFKEAALSARHTGNFAEAVNLLKKALDLSGDTDPFEIRAAIDALTEYLSAARRIRSEATFYRRAGRFDESHERLVELAKRYANSPEARHLTLPVQVTSDPDQARIIVDGEHVRIGEDGSYVDAETPFVIDLPAAQPVNLTLTRAGYADVSVSFHAIERSSLDVRLPRRPDRVTILPSEVIHPLVADGSRAIAVLRGGRVSALRADSLEVAWSHEFTDLREAAGPPAVEGGEVWIPVTGNAIVRLDAVTGRPRGETATPGRPVSPPRFSNDRVAVRLDGGDLAVGPRSGPLARITPPSSVSSGPAALSGGRFVVGCQDGRVWICGADGSLTAVLRLDPVDGAVTAIAVRADDVLVGTQSGAMVLIDTAAGATSERSDPTARVELETRSPVSEIRVDGRAVAATSGDQIVLVDLERPGVVARCDRVSTLGDGGGGVFAAGSPNGVIRIFSSKDLREIGTFSAEAPINVAGVVTGGRGVFAAQGGRVVGILCPSP